MQRNDRVSTELFESTRMKKMTALLATAATLSILAGCKQDKPAEVVQTVDWYKANKEERIHVVAKCKNNPGELAATPNCINATRAESSMVWSSRKGIEVKPMTAEELKNKR
jgi:predicted homoserine dehydrogenase-like protein